MNLKALATISSRRPSLPLRPWVKGACYDRLTRPGVTHCDLYAFREAGSGRAVFLICYSARGRELTAQDWFVLTDALEAIGAEQASALELDPVTWDKGSDPVFRSTHGALVAKARAHGLAPGHTSVLCHYVTRPDVDPWPRGFQNWYVERGKVALGAGALPDLL